MDNYKVTIGVDPGGTTGLAAYYYELQQWYRTQISNCDTREGLRRVTSMIHGIYRRCEPFLAKPTVHILCEQFDFRKDEQFRDKIDYTAREVIGVLKYEFGFVDFVRLDFTGASLGKGFWTDDKIRRLGLWEPGNKHAMDATRHVLRYRTFERNERDLLRPLRMTQLDDYREHVPIDEVRTDLV